MASENSQCPAMDMNLGKLNVKTSLMKRNKRGSLKEYGDMERPFRESITNLSSINAENTPAKRTDTTRICQRSSRRANVGILKTIRRKLPWNRRPNCPNSSSSTMRDGPEDHSEDSGGSLHNPNMTKSNGKTNKPKTRAICPMPSPLRTLRRSQKNENSSQCAGQYLRRASDAASSASGSERPENAMKNEPPDLAYSDYATPASLNTSLNASLNASLKHGIPDPGKEEEDYNVFHSRSTLTLELFKLSRYGWYWGPITRFEAEEKLHEQADGAFLVRDSSDDRYLLSLSFRSFGKTLHTRIEHCNGVFSFYANPESEGYDSIVDLIEHSMNYSQSGIFCYSRARTPGAPSLPVRLTKPVSRFTQVRSLQYLCRFVIRQYTRVDHIQELPLPNRIKGYIEERHY